MRRQAQIIVRSEVDHVLAIERGNRLLLAVEHPQPRRHAFRPQFPQRVGDKLQRILFRRLRCGV